MGFEYFTIPNILGLIGVVLILLAYFLLQLEKLQSSADLYLLMNFFGAAFILISLYVDFNLPSAIIESAWLAISLMGIIRKHRKKQISK
jgi:hypothetical protein